MLIDSTALQHLRGNLDRKVQARVASQKLLHGSNQLSITIKHNIKYSATSCNLKQDKEPTQQLLGTGKEIGIIYWKNAVIHTY